MAGMQEQAVSLWSTTNRSCGMVVLANPLKKRMVGHARPKTGHRVLTKLPKTFRRIGLILLDLMMPGMSGMEVLDQVRGDGPQLPVIVITGYATVESAVEAMKKGAYDFIANPSPRTSCDCR